MKGSNLAPLAVMAVMFLSFAFILSAPLPKIAHALATSTTTVPGWLIPDGAHFNNGIGALLFPLVGVGLFAGFGKLLDLDGDFGVTLILAGLTLGGVLAQLSINASNTNVLPFALILVPGIDLIIWMWKGGG